MAWWCMHRNRLVVVVVVVVLTTSSGGDCLANGFGIVVDGKNGNVAYNTTNTELCMGKFSE